MISGNMVGSYSQMGKTLILVDESGNEVTGVIVGEETVFTAGLNDIRAGKIAANAEGVVTGTKDIPAYRTQRGIYVIFDGEDFSMTLTKFDQYDYTGLQCLIAPFNTNSMDSVATDKIVLNDNVYLTNSLTSLSTVSKDTANKSIKLNLTNNSGKDYVIHYFTYRKEE